MADPAPERVRGTPKDPERARRLILDAALRRFAATGYRAVRVSDIARDAGYSEATVFHHFGTKADLFRAVVSSIDSQSPWFQPDADADALAEQMYEGELRYHRDGRLRSLDRVWAEAVAGEPDLLAMVRPALAVTLRGVESVLGNVGDADPAQRAMLARFLMAVSYGARAMRRYDNDVLSHEACADLLRYATQVAVASLRGEAPPIALTPPGVDEA
jgi:AcrR family transcriptional regulator